VAGIEVGGCKDTYENWRNGQLKKYLEQVNIEVDPIKYDPKT
jgi:hypothetical protein